MEALEPHICDVARGARHREHRGAVESCVGPGTRSRGPGKAEGLALEASSTLSQRHWLPSQGAGYSPGRRGMALCTVSITQFDWYFPTSWFLLLFTQTSTQPKTGILIFLKIALIRYKDILVSEIRSLWHGTRLLHFYYLICPFMLILDLTQNKAAIL
jgi:hypothetical protein